MPDLPFTIGELREALLSLDIQTYIHSGGQRHVFRCRYKGSEGALKLMLKRSTVETRARREVDAMRLVNSPNLVKILTNNLQSIQIVGVEYIYFIEEYVDGHDLAEQINESWSYLDIIRLIRDLVSAVKELWSYRIVHRDIKPSNIRIRPSGQAVLLDVGMARYIDRSTQTPPLVLVGTFGYHSPEQLRLYRRNLDFRSDLFLIGICIYEVIHKRNPFTEGIQNDNECYERILQGAAPSITSIDSNIPPPLATLIMSFLKPYAHLRPRSFEVIESLLEDAEEEIRCHS